MSALNLLHQPDTFGNYFQATPTPLPSMPYDRNQHSNRLSGVGYSGNKKVYRRNKIHQNSRHRPHSSRKPLNNPIDKEPLAR